MVQLHLALVQVLGLVVVIVYLLVVVMLLLNFYKTIWFLVLLFGFHWRFGDRPRNRQNLWRLLGRPECSLRLPDSLANVLGHLVLALEDETDLGPGHHELHFLHKVDFEEVLLLVKVLDGLDVDGDQLVQELCVQVAVVEQLLQLAQLAELLGRNDSAHRR